MSNGNTISARSNWLDSLILSFRIVFSKWPYLSIATITATIFWTVFSIFDQLLFFSPIVIFYLPDDAVIGFILSTLISILLGIIVSMNLYVLKHSKLKMNLASFFSGSTVSVLSSTCASCSSLGFLIVSTFGGAGIAAFNLSDQLSNSITCRFNSPSDMGFVFNK